MVCLVDILKLVFLLIISEKTAAIGDDPNSVLGVF